MRLKSPTETPISVALLSGHGISIGPEGRDVPAEFRKEAFIKGAIPDTGEAIEKAVPAATGKTHAELLVAGVKKYFEDGGEMTGAGLPNRNLLSKQVGFPVSAVDLEAAIKTIEAEKED